MMSVSENRGNYICQRLTCQRLKLFSSFVVFHHKLLLSRHSEKSKTEFAATLMDFSTFRESEIGLTISSFASITRFCPAIGLLWICDQDRKDNWQFLEADGRVKYFGHSFECRWLRILLETTISEDGLWSYLVSNHSHRSTHLVYLRDDSYQLKTRQLFGHHGRWSIELEAVLFKASSEFYVRSPKWLWNALASVHPHL